MDQNQSTHSEDPGGEAGKAVLEIPVAHVQAVQDFLAQLDEQDAEVSGYMLNLGMMGGGMSRLSASGGVSTSTGCTEYFKNGKWQYSICNDTRAGDPG